MPPSLPYNSTNASPLDLKSKAVKKAVEEVKVEVEKAADEVVEEAAEEKQDKHNNLFLKLTMFELWDRHPPSTMEIEPELTIGSKS